VGEEGVEEGGLEEMEVQEVVKAGVEMGTTTARSQANPARTHPQG
jgi:hypothetical protein